MFRPTSLWDHYIDQVHIFDDLVIRFSILTVTILFIHAYELKAITDLILHK